MAATGSSSPNITTPGFSTAPHSGQSGSGSSGRTSSPRARPQARQTRLADRAVHLDHVTGAGGRVQPVDVLRDQRLDEAVALELGERVVRGFGSRLREHVETQA